MNQGALKTSTKKSIAPFRFHIINKKIIFSVIIMFLGGILSFTTGFSLPPDHALPSIRQFIMWSQPVYVLMMAFYPVPYTFFSVSLFSLKKFVEIFGAFVFCLMIISLIKKRTVVLLLLLLSFALCYLMVFRIGFSLSARHAGLILMMVLFIFWIQSFYQDKDFKSRYLSWANGVPVKSMRYIALLLIGASLALSSRSTFLSMRDHSSLGVNEMTRFILDLDLKNRPIVSFPSHECAPLYALLPKHFFWAADTREKGTWYRMTNENVHAQDIPPLEVIVRAGREFQDLSDVFFLTAGRPFPMNFAFGYEFKLLKRTKHFYLYKTVFSENINNF